MGYILNLNEFRDRKQAAPNVTRTADRIILDKVKLARLIYVLKEHPQACRLRPVDIDRYRQGWKRNSDEMLIRALNGSLEPRDCQRFPSCFAALMEEIAARGLDRIS